MNWIGSPRPCSACSSTVRPASFCAPVHSGDVKPRRLGAKAAVAQRHSYSAQPLAQSPRASCAMPSSKCASAKSGRSATARCRSATASSRRSSRGSACARGVRRGGPRAENAIELAERFGGPAEAQQGGGAAIDVGGVAGLEREGRVVARERIGILLGGVLRDAEIGQRLGGARVAAHRGGEKAQRIGEAAALEAQ